MLVPIPEFALFFRYTTIRFPVCYPFMFTLECHIPRRGLRRDDVGRVESDALFFNLLYPHYGDTSVHLPLKFKFPLIRPEVVK